MTALIVIGVIFLIIALICLIPVGADIRFRDGVFSFAARVWLFSIRLGGEGKKKPDRGKKKKQKEQDEEADKPKKKLPPMALVRILLQNGYPMLCRIISRGRIDVLRIHFTAAGADPADAAMLYAAAGTAMDGLLHISSGRIRRPDLRADVDFESDKMLIDLNIRLTERIGGLLGAAIRFGVSFLIDFIRFKREE